MTDQDDVPQDEAPHDEASELTAAPADGVERVAAILREAIEGGDAPPFDIQDGEGGFPADGGDDHDAGPSDLTDPSVDMDVVRLCAGLDPSDTDNGLRLRHHFGQDLCVFAQEGVINCDYVVWTGTHWDQASGADRARVIAQKMGARIGMEAAFLDHSAKDRRVLKNADAARAKPEKTRTDADNDLIAEAERIKRGLAGRKSARRKFGVHTKNVGRIESMLKAAAPHMTRSPDDFNPDPLRFATLTHTLRFHLTEVEDLENPDPDGVRLVRTATLEATHGHDRAHMITQLSPVAYDAGATAPLFTAFMDRFQPVETTRRAIQIASGAGLLGLPVQRFFFHTGNGANGKSVFLELLTRVLGAMSIGLPAESILGPQTAAGGNASPDIARLYGRRLIRILELAEGEELKEALIKKLTGGERIPARTLFKGFFEFQPIGKVHASGNGYPKITGQDNGIWRRVTVFHWPVTLTEGEQKDFEEVLATFRPEWPGILNWLIEGARMFLEEGFKAPQSVKDDTAKYREEMDPISGFMATCLVRNEAMAASGKPAHRVQAREMYLGYRRWCDGNGKKPVHETTFGKIMDKHYRKNPKERVRHYDGVIMDLSGLPEFTRNPDDHG